MKKGTPSIAALERGLVLLGAVARDQARRPALEIGQALGLPIATTHRLATTLAKAGYLHRVRRGRYVAGPALLAVSETVSARVAAAEATRSVLARLTRNTGLSAHLGCLESNMVTYLIKEGSEPGLFTREGIQLEAYCSGIGKVLLAHLPEKAQAEYLANGPFIALTPRTITDPAALREAFRLAREKGYAVDDEEVVSGLTCLAVPVPAADGAVTFAISLSGAGAWLTGPTRLARLRAAALEAAEAVRPFAGLV
ncbi:IclR family transcriptional regulator [Sphingosinicella soli]|uniref:DNA-binding IclR family transcriptional regulator n=1 Tax=Sphingosinicella soli TaxID=333708 RepID=A0A7W7B2T8_9SPHN|nr:IclR family transcriptional regulator [Sphingosinicella soli]MBB4632911.1 DNA-binding IclR family transcriptional regulator [Sphingosinicella soli]